MNLIPRNTGQGSIRHILHEDPSRLGFLDASLKFWDEVGRCFVAVMLHDIAKPAECLAGWPTNDPAKVPRLRVKINTIIPPEQIGSTYYYDAAFFKGPV